MCRLSARFQFAVCARSSRSKNEEALAIEQIKSTRGAPSAGRLFSRFAKLMPTHINTARNNRRRVSILRAFVSASPQRDENNRANAFCGDKSISLFVLSARTCQKAAAPISSDWPRSPPPSAHSHEANEEINQSAAPRHKTPQRNFFSFSELPSF